MVAGVDDGWNKVPNASRVKNKRTQTDPDDLEVKEAEELDTVEKRKSRKTGQ